MTCTRCRLKVSFRHRATSGRLTRSLSASRPSACFLYPPLGVQGIQGYPELEQRIFDPHIFLPPHFSFGVLVLVLDRRLRIVLLFRIFLQTKKAVCPLFCMAILPFDYNFSFCFCWYPGCFRGTPAYRMIPLAVNPQPGKCIGLHFYDGPALISLPAFFFT